ncbi:2OG-Fe(II) oxygenase [Pseudorhodoferax sp.]|uniref:2OG-Fe(II) oxygenase n=1 Tax=Pseudorhodoferax sp. TaxID=1993553 RepID=UPI0039E4E1F5
MHAPSDSLSPILRALQELPRETAPAGTPGFSAEGMLALDALAVEVAGVGPLAQPLAAAAAQALHGASTPARHGLREATRLDRRVRDTGEIAAGALALHWRDGALPALLADVAQRLGLPGLQARVHNLLVYGPGQFFKPHQDTEKHPGMVATLVLVWPSAHIGGELRVRHGDAQAGFASQHLQAPGLRWFAFYADCRHEVLPVAEGWRVVLTLDLVLPPGAPARPSAPDPALLAALRARFETPDGPRSEPWAFLLEHEYTEHGLRWALLKGDDRLHVHALRAAAQALGLRMHLALAEIHESWTAVMQPGRRGREEPEADELIDEDIGLDFWVDADDQPRRGAALALSPRDAEGFSETGESFLVDEAYEGYMGNYGETLDFWYRRAALVLQTPHGAEASRFVSDIGAALDDALALARQPGGGEALARRLAAARGALQFHCRNRGRAVLAAYAELACALPDAAQARALCDGFRWADLQPGDAPALARLAGRFGAAWTQQLLEQAWAPLPASPWSSPWYQAEQEPRLWPSPLRAFLDACSAAGVPAALGAAMRTHCLALLAGADKALARATPAQRQATLPLRLAAVCELADALQPWPAQATPQQRSLLEHLRAHPLAYPLRELAPLWKVLPRNTAAAPEVRALQAAVAEALRQALARPAPDASDASLDALDIEWTCRCADCSQVIRWAGQPAAQPLVLAMAEARRTHVQSQLQAAAAPIGAQTLRQGSPHKLVLDKPADLAARRAARRQAWQDALAATAPGAKAPRPRAL